MVFLTLSMWILHTALPVFEFSSCMSHLLHPPIHPLIWCPLELSPFCFSCFYSCCELISTRVLHLLVCLLILLLLLPVLLLLWHINICLTFYTFISWLINTSRRRCLSLAFNFMYINVHCFFFTVHRVSISTAKKQANKKATRRRRERDIRGRREK